MIEIEVQNETHQNQTKVKFLVVPRIGEGIRLLEPDGQWGSFDVLDVWYERRPTATSGYPSSTSARPRPKPIMAPCCGPRWSCIRSTSSSGRFERLGQSVADRAQLRQDVRIGRAC